MQRARMYVCILYSAAMVARVSVCNPLVFGFVITMYASIRTFFVGFSHRRYPLSYLAVLPVHYLVSNTVT